MREMPSTEECALIDLQEVLETMTDEQVEEVMRRAQAEKIARSDPSTKHRYGRWDVYHSGVGGKNQFVIKHGDVTRGLIRGPSTGDELYEELEEKLGWR